MNLQDNSDLKYILRYYELSMYIMPKEVHYTGTLYRYDFELKYYSRLFLCFPYRYTYEYEYYDSDIIKYLKKDTMFNLLLEYYCGV